MPELTEYEAMSPHAKAVVERIAPAQKGNKIATAYRVPVDAAFEEN